MECAGLKPIRVLSIHSAVNVFSAKEEVLGDEMGSKTLHKLWCSSGYENLVRVSDRFRCQQWPDE